MPETDDFADVLRRLNADAVRYVLIGGLAMMLHGSSHVTQDIDIGYDVGDPANREALARALGPLHPRLRGVPADLPFIMDARTFSNTQNLTLVTDLAERDLLGHIPGAEDFEGLYARSEAVELDGIPVRVASLDDLIAMKRAANRPKDQVHLLELEALKRIVTVEKGTRRTEPGDSGPG